MLFSLLGNNTEKPVTNIFLIPGAFLLSSFFLAAFYIPCFLFAGSVLLIKQPFYSSRLIVLILSIIPFLTCSLFLHVISMEKIAGSSLAFFIQSILGKIPGGIFLLILFIIELYLIYNYAQFTQKKHRNSFKIKETSTPDLIYLEHEKNEHINKRAMVLNIHRMYKKHKDQAKKPGNMDTRKEKQTNQDKDDRNATGIKLALPGYKGRKNKPFLSLPEPEKKECVQDTDPGLLHLPDELEDIPVDEFEILDDINEQEEVIRDGIEEVHEKEINEKPEKENGEEIEHPSSLKLPKKPVRKYNTGPYSVPVDGILKDYEDGNYWTVDSETKNAGQILMDTLKEFNITAEVTGIRKGPVITMFEILPSPGVKLSKIVNLADNIALRLAASRVRIVAPIPGKHAVGIEVPNKKRAIVSFKEMVILDIFMTKKYVIPIIIGKDIAGEAQIIDLVQTPHLLIAGATGSGKSVCVNSIICSILYRKSPDEVKLLLIDPKIVELKFYNDTPHLLTPVVTNPHKAFQALQYCLCEMERRYSLLDAMGVRDIHSFNNKVKNKKLTISNLPYIVIIIDEFADLIANTGKEMEQTIARLAAMSRAVGLHLVLATQRPSVEVITGLIKANIPSRIAFMVASKFDSRIIIDCVGAEKLLGKGDMLITTAWDPVPVRIQGSYVSEEEVENLVQYIKTLGEPDYIDEEIFIDDEEEEDIQFGETDPLMEKAMEIVVAKGKASASYLQRRLKIGYNRAARIVEEMEMRGIVGPPNGSKPRELLHIPDRK
ncbi:MAG: DNA translocase FtsK [Spirochaetales bacterium]|nr:DNA translocase FtsK [Spirochaetales bacterium]